MINVFIYKFIKMRKIVCCRTWMCSYTELAPYSVGIVTRKGVDGLVFLLEMPPQLYFLINWLQSCKNSTVHYKKLLVQQIKELQKQCNSTINGHFYRYLMLMFYTQYKDSIHSSLHPYLTVIVSPDCFSPLSFQTNFLSAHFLLF